MAILVRQRPGKSFLARGPDVLGNLWDKAGRAGRLEVESHVLQLVRVCRRGSVDHNAIFADVAEGDVVELFLKRETRVSIESMEGWNSQVHDGGAKTSRQP
jgi:hypothetical protein